MSIDTAVPDAKTPDAGGCCTLSGSELFDRLIKKTIMKEDKRIRINKRMMAWSNGERINVIPSVWCEVDDYGKTLIGYHRKQNPRLWPLLEDSWTYRAYRRYLSTLGSWARE